MFDLFSKKEKWPCIEWLAGNSWNSQVYSIVDNFRIVTASYSIICDFKGIFHSARVLIVFQATRLGLAPGDQ